MSQRPCQREHPTPQPETGCVSCRLFLKDRRYNLAWGGNGSVQDGPCVHLGAATGATVPCPGCKGTVRLKTFSCAVHGTCLPSRKVEGAACCLDCPDWKTMDDGRVREGMNLDSLVALLGGPVPNPHWPAGWERWQVTEEAHRRLLGRMLDAPPVYPGGCEGRGVVTCGGGARYFTAAYVALYLLRRLGCTLPVELWHLGPEECDPEMASIVGRLGNVAVRDAHEVASCLESRPRLLGGWESKVFAVRHSRFEEVLFLDADQVPARDPTYLFDDARYRAKGAVLWPDLPNRWGFDIEAQAFRTLGLPVPGRSRLPAWHMPSDYRPVDSGQVLIDKARCWPEVCVASWMADHADYFYRGSSIGHGKNLMYGDKSCFFGAWWAVHAHRLRARGQRVDYFDPPFAMPRDTAWAGSGAGGAFIQHDLDGRVVFQHRCQPATKWSLHGDNKDCRLINWDLCLEALARLRGEWIGHPWDWSGQREENAAGAHRAAGRWHYSRPGEDRRPVLLAPGGRVQGGGERAHHWTLRHRRGKDGTARPCLVLASQTCATAFLFEDGKGNWHDPDRGQWLAPAPPEGFELGDDPMAAGIWADVYLHNEYRLPRQLPAGTVVLDVGAHVGVFSRLCLDRGAAAVCAVEPNPQNFALLRHNLGRDPRALFIQGAAWTGSGTLRLDFPEGARHSGGGCVVDVPGGQEVPAISFDDVARALARNHSTNGRVQLVKFDCESSEWPILYASQALHLIDAVAGEYHLARLDPRYSLEGLWQVLEGAGFRAHIDPANEWGLGHFWATRPGAGFAFDPTR